MKLLHWNVHMWQDGSGASNVDAVIELIRREAPDVVSLVEVDERWGRPSALQQIADELSYCWEFAPAFEYRSEGGFGNALLSRTPFRTLQQWELLSPRLYDGTEPSEQRAVVLAQVEVEGQVLWVGSTHLPRGDATQRRAASHRLLALLEQQPEPWVLAGDFNQLPSEWLPQLMSVVPDPVEATHPADAPDEAIDYFVLEGCKGDGEILHYAGSDHLPVVAAVDVTS